MEKAYVHFAEGFEEIEAITIVDVLRRAKIETLTISITGKKEVNGSHGIGIITDQLFEDTDYTAASILILPGGMPGASNLRNHEGLCNQLISFNEANKKIAAICAAPMVLGQLNILMGKEAVCYPGYENQLLGAKISLASTIISKNIITGRGAGVAIEFALLIVESTMGKTVANSIALAMMVND